MPTLFSLPEHHAFVMRHGQRLLHYTSSLCPCGATPDANRSKVTCNLCGGLGLQYGEPQEMTALVTSINREKHLLEAGIAQPGDLVLSPSPYESQVIADWDSIEILDDRGQVFQGELIKRGVNSLSDLLAYKVVNVLDCHSVTNAPLVIVFNDQETTDHWAVTFGAAITFEATVDVGVSGWITGDTEWLGFFSGVPLLVNTEIVDAVEKPADLLVTVENETLNYTEPMPALRRIDYVEGEDFTIDERILTWVAGKKQPPAEGIYSIKYTAKFAWVAYNSQQDRADAEDDIGSRVFLRLRHLVMNRT